MDREKYGDLIYLTFYNSILGSKNKKMQQCFNKNNLERFNFGRNKNNDL